MLRYGLRRQLFTATWNMSRMATNGSVWICTCQPTPAVQRRLSLLSMAERGGKVAKPQGGALVRRFPLMLRSGYAIASLNYGLTTRRCSLPSA